MTNDHTKQIEHAIIGACMTSQHALITARELLSGDEWEDEAARESWLSITILDDANQPVDLITTTRNLRDRGKLDNIGGPAMLSRMVETITATSRTREYCETIKARFVIRRLRYGMMSLIKTMDTAWDAEAVLNQTEQMLYQAREGKQGIEIYRADQIAQAPITAHSQAMANPQHCIGVPSYIDGLDQFIRGFRPGTLTFIGARPSVGKTSLGCAMAIRMSRIYSTMIISLEMSYGELSTRIMAAETGYNSERIDSGNLTPDQVNGMTEKAKDIAGRKLSIIDKSGINVNQIRALARREKIAGRLDVIIIDHFQIIGIPGKGTRYAEFSEISTTLKRMAKELNIPVICLAQLSRDAGDDEPKMYHLKETGSIEQDADMVILMHRPEEGGDKLQLIVAKNRAGRVGRIEYRFIPQYCRFESLLTLAEQKDGLNY